MFFLVSAWKIPKNEACAANQRVGGHSSIACVIRSHGSGILWIWETSFRGILECTVLYKPRCQNVLALDFFVLDADIWDNGLANSLSWPTEKEIQIWENQSITTCMCTQWLVINAVFNVINSFKQKYCCLSLKERWEWQNQKPVRIKGNSGRCGITVHHLWSAGTVYLTSWQSRAQFSDI